MTETPEAPPPPAAPPAAAPSREPAPDERELYRRFLEKRRQCELEKAAENRQRMERATYEVEHRVARALGEAADNGHGVCRWCGLTLGHVVIDGMEYRTHPPVRECPGPPPPACELCHRAWWFDTARHEWTHECTAATRVAPAKTQIARPGGQGYFGHRREDR